MPQWSLCPKGNFIYGSIEVPHDVVVKVLNNYARCVQEAREHLSVLPMDCVACGLPRVLGLIARFENNPVGTYPVEPFTRK